jgi:hypothetical protein
MMHLGRASATLPGDAGLKLYHNQKEMVFLVTYTRLRNNLGKATEAQIGSSMLNTMTITFKSVGISLDEQRRSFYK